MTHVFGDPTAAAVFEFLDQWAEDCARGAPRTLSEYLQRFPDHEDAVAREFLRVRHGPEKPIEAAAPKSERKSGAARYTHLGEVGKGGMGSVARVRDEALGRDLALKTMLARGPRKLARFLEEAQITGELEHPNIVPVHELCADDEANPFYTMRLVRGRTLREIVALAEAREGGWSRTRALEVLLKVCDAVAFAHSKGIVHRDLKPSNVMVGAFGEVYVMDWGLATRLGEPDLHDIRLRPTRGPSDAPPRAVSASPPSGTPLATMDGDVVGTPCYMSPEQAAGNIGEVGPRSDVYSVGAMLYHLLAGEMPYVARDERIASADVLQRVLAAPPRAVRELRPDVPAELAAICEKAMARDAADRYPDLASMARDLRAYLELRVVSAYQTGPAAELRKWVARNRALAVTLLGTLVAAFAALLVVVWLQDQSRGRLELLADSRGPASLRERADELWARTPVSIEGLEQWLSDARAIVARREGYREALRALRRRALPHDPNSPAELRARWDLDRKIRGHVELVDYYGREAERMRADGGVSEEGMSLEEVEARIDELSRNLAMIRTIAQERHSWSFADPRDQLQHDTLSALVPELDALAGDGPMRGLVPRMQQRLDFLRSASTKTLDEQRDAWNVAIASISNRAECPRYAGLSIHPQVGLVPIRRDPDSGLWEFLHVQTGAAPQIGADGRYVVTDETGIVLVLVPGGRFFLGAQRSDLSGVNFDPYARADEALQSATSDDAVLRIIAPFFVSKYEMTQPQWERIAGENPSLYGPQNDPRFTFDGVHPVDSVDWLTSVRLVREVGLNLPTETQWEFAARGGTDTPWWTGCEVESLPAAANLADLSSWKAGTIGNEAAPPTYELDDGFAVHAPVGSFRPNPFGLFDVIGNVAEWCRDTGSTDYATEVRLHTGESTGAPRGLRTYRGGSYLSLPRGARSASRAHAGPQYARPGIGLRPSRDLDV